MTWLLVATLAQLILGTSGVFDKLLLRRGFFDPWVYTFWLGVLGIFSVILLPFGFESVPLYTIFLALLGGAVFVFAMLAMFFSLNRGYASETLPIIGGFSPVFTLFIGFLLLEDKLFLTDLIGFAFLVIGGFLLFLTAGERVNIKSLSLILFSAALFGLTNVLTKIVFDDSNFITGFFLIKTGAAFTVLTFLFYPRIRVSIVASRKESVPRNQFLYITNRAYAGLGSVLLYIAIFLAHPALVDATQSLRYIVIFFVSWLLLKEVAKGKALLGKIIATVLIIIGFTWLGLVSYSRGLPALNPDRPIAWGVTFSDKFARQLGLDSKETFTSIMQELHPKKVRLVAYWDEIEKEKGHFDFSELDNFLEIAESNGAQIVLALGMKAPRWPECHIPSWANNLSSEDREKALLEYMEETIHRYKVRESIMMWQVENEPFLLFGRCPGRAGDYMKSEVELVKSIDPSRPIVTTDGGETGLWFRAARYGDIFGSTMYRKVYPVSIGKWVGVIEYPLGPNYFRVKEKLTRFISSDYEKRFIIIELQGEPWGEVGTPDLSYERQMELFSLDYFRDTVRYAKDSGFNEYYLWGGEWWYWLKTKHNDDRFWNEAKMIFAQ